MAVTNKGLAQSNKSLDGVRTKRMWATVSRPSNTPPRALCVCAVAQWGRAGGLRPFAARPRSAHWVGDRRGADLTAFCGPDGFRKM
jgi:hypothetical protein